MEDMVPPDRRSIKQVSIPDRRRPTGPVEHIHVIDTDKEPKETKQKITPSSPDSVVRSAPAAVPPRREHYGDYSNDTRATKSHSRLWLWGIAIVCIVIVAFALSLLFAGAKVVVTAKQAAIPVHVALSASNDPNSAGLQYQVVTLVKDQTASVPATGSATTSTKASGTIIIYNNYSSASQTLVANTRFQSDQGLIYRIASQIKVPGMQTQAGKKVPGSIEAVVYADQPGANYNIGLTDFTIPGFKGDPRYDGFYARSSTAMTGGFSGLQMISASSTVAQARTALDSQLENTLLDQARTQIPADYIVYDNGYQASFNTMPTTQTATSVVVDERATINFFTFKKDDLDKAILTQVSPDIAGDLASSSVAISGTDKLQFTLAAAPATSTAPVAKTTASSTAPALSPLHFTLDGSLNALWQYSSADLQNALAGKSKSDIPAITNAFPGIAKIQVTIRPFWKSSFPDDPQKISVVDSTGK
jgi:hypothetical protein